MIYLLLFDLKILLLIFVSHVFFKHFFQTVNHSHLSSIIFQTKGIRDVQLNNFTQENIQLQCHRFIALRSNKCYINNIYLSEVI